MYYAESMTQCTRFPLICRSLVLLSTKDLFYFKKKYKRIYIAGYRSPSLLGGLLELPAMYQPALRTYRDMQLSITLSTTGVMELLKIGMYMDACRQTLCRSVHIMPCESLSGRLLQIVERLRP